MDRATAVMICFALAGVFVSGWQLFSVFRQSQITAKRQIVIKGQLLKENEDMPWETDQDITGRGAIPVGELWIKNINTVIPGDKGFRFHNDRLLYMMKKGDTITFGREPDSQIRVSPIEMTISRKHFSISYQDNGWMIKDLGSTNGTFVNGKRIPSNKVVLADAGDVIKAGGIEMEVI